METKMSTSTRASDQDIIIETEKLIILKDKHGMYGDAAPSKVAPQYLQELLDTPFLDQDDDPSSMDLSFDSACSRTYEELEEWKKRVQEEERLSRMYKLKRTFSLRFDNRAWLHPHGTTNFDYKAISGERKANFEKFKNRVREENYQYLGFHPEIHAIISLALKRLLTALPQDPVKFLTDFFTTRMGNMQEFQDSVEAEGQKISKYRVNKMRAAGQINLRPSTEVRTEISGETWRPEQDANHFKKLNIGALAQEFSFDENFQKHKKTKSVGENLKLNKKSKKNRHKCGPNNYCGCKDWKLKKNRTSTAMTDGEEAKTTTLSTLGNLNDNLLSSEEEGEEEEEEMQFGLGDGQFLGEMEERTDADGNLTAAEAEMIAGLLVQEFLGGGAGVQAKS